MKIKKHLIILVVFILLFILAFGIGILIVNKNHISLYKSKNLPVTTNIPLATEVPQKTLKELSTSIEEKDPDRIDICGEDPTRTKDHETKVWGKYKIICYFDSTEWGDYRHLTIKDLEGNYHSLFIGFNFDEEINCASISTKLDDDPELRKKKIELIWYEISKYIPEAGGEMKIDVGMKINFLE